MIENYSDVVIKVEVETPGYDSSQFNNNEFTIKEEITEEISNSSDSNIELEDNFPDIKKEITQDINDNLVKYDEKLKMKCSVELHNGDFCKTSHCLRCRKVKGIELTCDLSRKCGSFTSNIALRHHLIKKHKVHSFRCPICETVVKGKQGKNLQSHIAIVHLGYKKFSCNVCQKNFTDKESTQKHMEEHGYHENWDKYVTLASLEESLNHGNYITVDCRYCDKNFFTDFELKLHLKKHIICDVCGKDFPTKLDKSMHLKTHKKEINNRSSCQLCKKDFDTIEDYRKHVKRHQNKCCLCNKKFLNRFRKRNHVDSVHMKQIHTCEQCGKDFRNRESFNNHVLAHSGIKPFTCERCGVSLATRGSLKSHVKRIHESKKKEKEGSTCRICKKNFGTRKECRKHTRAYGRTCCLCEMKFLNRFRKRNHVDSVHLRQTHTCEQCGKVFRTRESFKNHVLAHGGVKPFTCEHCGLSLSTRRNLKSHVERIHKGTNGEKTNKKLISCNICGEKFSTKNLRLEHLNSVHDQKHYKCQLCEETFRYRQLLSNHIHLHHGTAAFTCDFCGKAFTDRSNISLHIKSKHLKEENIVIQPKYHLKVKNDTYECGLCDLKFLEPQLLRCHVNKEHGAVKVDEKNFECELCKKKYVTKTTLKTHLMSIHFKKT